MLPVVKAGEGFRIFARTRTKLEIAESVRMALAIVTFWRLFVQEKPEAETKSSKTFEQEGLSRLNCEGN